MGVVHSTGVIAQRWQHPALQDPVHGVQQPQAVWCVHAWPPSLMRLACCYPPACLVTQQELYGDEVGGAMLNALSRLFTARLQDTGFTCGMDDLLLTAGAEAGRSQVGVYLLTNSCPGSCRQLDAAVAVCTSSVSRFRALGSQVLC
jgi:hypothetical protein